MLIIDEHLAAEAIFKLLQMCNIKAMPKFNYTMESIKSKTTQINAYRFLLLNLNINNLTTELTWYICQYY